MFDRKKSFKNEVKSLYSNASQKSSGDSKKNSFFDFAAILTDKSSKCESFWLPFLGVLKTTENAVMCLSNERTQAHSNSLQIVDSARLGRKNRCLPHHGTARTFNGVRANPWVSNMMVNTKWVSKSNFGIRISKKILKEEPFALLNPVKQ